MVAAEGPFYKGTVQLVYYCTCTSPTKYMPYNSSNKGCVFEE